MKQVQVSDHETVKLIEHGSADYAAIVALRYEILRKPLNLKFTEDQLAAEKNYFHLAYYHEDTLVASLILVPEENNKVKMKQVVVAEHLQGKGVGAKLVFAAEQFAIEKGFNFIYCHARDTAVPFYLKLNYRKVGEMFEEVTIPHWEMEKDLY